MLTTPPDFFPELAAIRSKLKLAAEPIFLRVRPLRDSVPDNCTEDVKKRVTKDGGSAVLGWLVWYWAGIMAEATFHVIWRSPSGALLDVSRKTDGEDRILFIPDPTLSYTGERIDTVRFPLRSHPLIQEYIQVGDDFDREYVAQYGRRHLGDITLRGRMLDLYRRKAALEPTLSTLAKVWSRGT